MLDPEGVRGASSPFKPLAACGCEEKRFLGTPQTPPGGRSPLDPHRAGPCATVNAHGDGPAAAGGAVRAYDSRSMSVATP